MKTAEEWSDSPEFGAILDNLCGTLNARAINHFVQEIQRDVLETIQWAVCKEFNNPTKWPKETPTLSHKAEQWIQNLLKQLRDEVK